MRTFVMGGTGLVGSRLLKRLLERKDEVVLLTRRPEAARIKWGNSVTIVTGDPMQPGPWQDELVTCASVVNLVGEGVFARRWTTKFKALLRDSRVKPTENVIAALQKNRGQVQTLVNASAIGYYGPHGDEEVDEKTPPGADYLALLCVEWEQAALPASSLGVRTSLLRVGVVLDNEGGALRQMVTPFKLFIGGPVGSGKQYFSWIHHEDMVGLILLALDNSSATGPMNATAPNPVTNRAFSTALGKVLGRPSFMPAPWLGLRVLLGEVASVITKGQRVMPRVALALGYEFKFPTVEAALQDVLKRATDHASGNSRMASRNSAAD